MASFWAISFISHFQLPSVGPTQQADILFLSLSTFAQSIVSLGYCCFVFFWFYPFSALFLWSQQAPTYHAIDRYFKESCFASLLERSSPFFPCVPVILYELKPLWMNFIALTHKFQLAHKLNSYWTQFALGFLWLAPVAVAESWGKNLKSFFTCQDLFLHVPPMCNY